MENKKDFKLERNQADGKQPREYLRDSVKAAKHPTRAKILKLLEESEKSTVDLESQTNETRYNLYHHLNTLEDSGLIAWKMRDNKTKVYSLPQHPKLAIVVLEHDVLQSKPYEFNSLLEIVSMLEGRDIQHRDKIDRVEIFLNYKWEDEPK